MSSNPADGESPSSVLGMLVSFLVGCLLFVPAWAGLNFAFGTALDGPVGAVIMQEPCQRLAGTTEPLTRYALGSGGKGRRLSASVCHFGSRRVRVDGPTDGLGFTGRELLYLVVGFAGYAVCFAGAIALSIFTVVGGRRLLSRSR